MNWHGFFNHTTRRTFERIGLGMLLDTINAFDEQPLVDFARPVDVSAVAAVERPNAALLTVRIRAEEAALGPAYARAFSKHARFVPGVGRE